MAGEFQGHVDEMVREANLHEVRDQFNQIRNFDVKGEIAKAVDGDGSIRATFAENPLSANNWTPDPVPDVTPTPVAVPDPVAVAHDAPSFIPPLEAAAHVPAPAPVAEPVAPAFIPPSVAAGGTASPTV
jgi:sec-independent protein translocase protein TatB